MLLFMAWIGAAKADGIGFTYAFSHEYETRGGPCAGNGFGQPCTTGDDVVKVDDTPAGTAWVSPHHQLPSLDLRTKGWTIQMDVLELVASMTRKEPSKDYWEARNNNRAPEGGDTANQLHLGVNAFNTNIKRKVAEQVEGVVQPGFSVDLDTNTSFGPANFMLLGAVRMGAQADKGMGVGLYVVPELGIASVFDVADAESDYKTDLGLAVGGQLQLSVWARRK
jgi:hypothetical protein